MSEQIKVAMNDIQAIRQVLEDWRRGPFEGSVEQAGEKVCLAVQHDDHDEDHCDGQSEVRGKLIEMADILGVSLRNAEIQHSGGFASVYVNATMAEIAGNLRAGATND
ncbi:MAG: hypothetical protein M3O30_17325 [Planctomycetota bacterium]|nr:hypothetical protein [Planctomycetota bacterium]